MRANKLRIFPVVVIITLLLSSCGNIQSAEACAEETEKIVLKLADTDKQTVFLSYLQTTIKEDFLESLPEIKNATVMIACPADTDILIHSEDEIRVGVVLDLEEELTTYSPAELADALAAYVGNTTTDKITIFDSEDHMLFPETK